MQQRNPKQELIRNNKENLEVSKMRLHKLQQVNHILVPTINQRMHMNTKDMVDLYILEIHITSTLVNCNIHIVFSISHLMEDTDLHTLHNQDQIRVILLPVHHQTDHMVFQTTLDHTILEHHRLTTMFLQVFLLELQFIQILEAVHHQLTKIRE